MNLWSSGLIALFPFTYVLVVKSNFFAKKQIILELTNESFSVFFLVLQLQQNDGQSEIMYLKEC
jgi:hypothetical protein